MNLTNEQINEKMKLIALNVESQTEETEDRLAQLLEIEDGICESDVIEAEMV
jgi:hypothetical protein